MELSKHDFEALTGKIKDYSGIVLSTDKEYLLESRLMPVVKKYSLGDLSGLVGYMQENQDESLLVEVIECMTTNESFFFRDFKPFDTLRDTLLPQIIQQFPDKEKIRIWSAASSTGQEAYSIAMTILESPAFAKKTFEIVGTDIDLNVIEKARDGVYSQFEVQRGMPINLLMKYFKQEGDQWRIKDEIKEMITFNTFNLLHSAGGLGIFDVVFCRNVLIYFDDHTKSEVLENISKTMEPHSKLITGSAESLIGIESPFKPVAGLSSVFGL